MKKRNTCLECGRRWKREWVDKNRDRINLQNREKYSSLTPSELEELRAAKRKENLTPEQIEKHNNTSRKHWNGNKVFLNEMRKSENLIPDELMLRRERGRAAYIKHKEKRLLSDAKRRAKRNGLEFDLTVDDIVIPEVCPVLGIPIHRDCEMTARNNSPSLDRIDNSKGYVKGNVRVISWRANAIKRDSTIEELKKIIEYMTH